MVNINFVILAVRLNLRLKNMRDVSDIKKRVRLQLFLVAHGLLVLTPLIGRIKRKMPNFQISLI